MPTDPTEHGISFTLDMKIKIPTPSLKRINLMFMAIHNLHYRLYRNDMFENTPKQPTDDSSFERLRPGVPFDSE